MTRYAILLLGNELAHALDGGLPVTWRSHDEAQKQMRYLAPWARRHARVVRVTIEPKGKNGLPNYVVHT